MAFSSSLPLAQELKSALSSLVHHLDQHSSTVGRIQSCLKMLEFVLKFDIYE